MASRLPRWEPTATAVIVILSVAAVLLGLLQPSHYPEALRDAFNVQDVLVAVVGLPVLWLSLHYALRGSLRGRLVWLGSLAYLAYIWASMALQIGFTRFFLGYVVLFSLSLYALLRGLIALDPTDVEQAVSGRISERLYGAFLWLIAVGLAGLWLAELVPATVSGTPPPLVTEVGPQALASHFIDLSIVVPALALAGTWLWRRRPWGYVLAGVMLVFGALLAPTLTGMTVLFLLRESVTVSPIAAVLTGFPALLAAVLAVRYLARMRH